MSAEDTERELREDMEELRILAAQVAERPIPTGIKATVEDMLKDGVGAYGKFFPISYFYDRIGIDVNVIEIREDGSAVNTVPLADRLRRKEDEKKKFDWGMLSLRVILQTRGYYLTDRTDELVKHDKRPGEGYAFLSQESMATQTARDIRKVMNRLKSTAVRTVRVDQTGMTDSAKRQLDKQAENSAFYVGVMDRGRKSLLKMRKLRELGDSK
jgi:hypothetical protein